jgi:hypothetical protein
MHINDHTMMSESMAAAKPTRLPLLRHLIAPQEHEHIRTLETVDLETLVG